MDMWLTVQECAGLPGLPSAPTNITNRLKKIATPDAMRKRAGTKAIEFHVSCLSPAARAAAFKRLGVVEVGGQSIEIKPRERGEYSRELLWQRANGANDKQREKARAKFEVVNAVAALLDSGVDTVTAFESVASSHSVPAASVRRWYYAAIKFDRSDWFPALLGKYQARRKSLDAECTPEAWDFFLADYLREEGTSLRTTYYRLRDVAKKNGWVIPSMSATRRRLEREIPAEQRVLLRDGEHALMNLYPAQQRSVADLEAMEWINGDGYQHNCFVHWFNGEILPLKHGFGRTFVPVRFWPIVQTLARTAIQSVYLLLMLSSVTASRATSL